MNNRISGQSHYNLQSILSQAILDLKKTLHFQDFSYSMNFLKA